MGESKDKNICVMQKKNEYVNNRSHYIKPSNDKSKESELNCNKVIDLINLRNEQKNDDLIKRFSSSKFVVTGRNEAKNSKTNNHLDKGFDSSKKNKILKQDSGTKQQPKFNQSDFERKTNYSYNGSTLTKLGKNKNLVYNNEPKTRSQSINLPNQYQSSESKFGNWKNTYDRNKTDDTVKRNQFSRNLE